MRRPWLAVPLVALAVAGCGVRPSAVITGAPAPSGPANGAVLYFLADGQPVRVLRPLAEEATMDRTIALLAAGPDESERELRYTNEVPPGVTVVDQEGGAGRVTVTLTVNVSALSPRAVDQIVCTVRDTLVLGPRITLRGGGSERAPQSCPLPG